MSYAVAFALLSLLFAGINDVVFKKHALGDHSTGAYIFGIGTVWSLLQFSTLYLKQQSPVFDIPTLSFGLWVGLLLTVSNILLIESLSRIHVSLGSTIYRLNTIGVVLLSILFLHEPLGTTKLMGILCGIIGVTLLYQRNGSKLRGSSDYRAYTLLAVAASLCRAGYGVISKAGIMVNADLHTMILISALCWIAGGICYAMLRERSLRVTKYTVGYAIVSGILVYLIVNCLMTALSLLLRCQSHCYRNHEGIVGYYEKRKDSAWYLANIFRGQRLCQT